MKSNLKIKSEPLLYTCFKLVIIFLRLVYITKYLHVFEILLMRLLSNIEVNAQSVSTKRPNAYNKKTFDPLS